MGEPEVMGALQVVQSQAFKLVARPAGRGKSAAYTSSLLEAIKATIGTNSAVEFPAMEWNDCVRFKINKHLPGGHIVRSRKTSDTIITLWAEAK